MPNLAYGLTFRQERFCHAFLRLANAAEAAREAGYSERSARKQACRLLQTQRIRFRLADIQTETAQHACFGLNAMLAKLQNVYERAIEDRRYYAAARAVDIQARLIGLRERRFPVGVVPDRRPVASRLAGPPPVPPPVRPPFRDPADEEDLADGEGLSDVASWPAGRRK